MRLFCRLPRIGGILMALFIALFALDVFSEHTGFQDAITALAMHLIPSAVLVIALLVAWKWERVGAIAYLALAILYTLTAWGRFPFSVYLIIAGPLLLIGLLFWLSRKYRFPKADANSASTT